MPLFYQAALLLETLLLDALVARPEASLGLSRSGLLGRSGTGFPRRSWGTSVASGGDMGFVSASGGGGSLSEADQRTLQVSTP